VDHHRSLRRGFPEVVYGAGKTVDQIVSIAESMVDKKTNLLVTRCDIAAGRSAPAPFSGGDVARRSTLLHARSAATAAQRLRARHYSRHNGYSCG
jgi:NCAIR mutase (PurE)-related protein